MKPWGLIHRGEHVERNFVLVRLLKNELSFHIWRNEYKLDLKGLNFTTNKHNGLDCTKCRYRKKLDIIFEIILDLYNNTY